MGIVVFCNNHLEPRKIVIPAKAGTRPSRCEALRTYAVSLCFKALFPNCQLLQVPMVGQVPAFAGMTKNRKPFE